MYGKLLTKIFGLSIAFIGLIGLAGCSFQPLHGTTTSGALMKDEMAAVEIPILNGRVAQQVRNELIFKTTGGGHPLPPKYRLSIAVKESIQSVALRSTGDAGSKVYRLDANFTLTDSEGKKEFFKGRTSSRASFDKFDSTFANIRAERDAGNRAAKVVAGDIYNRVAAVISGQS